MPGHGLSSGEPVETVEIGAGWLLQFVDVLELEVFVLIGHSLGALMSLELAARVSGRVLKLALLGVTSKVPVHRELLDAADVDEPLAVELITGWALGKRAHRGGNIASGIWMMGGCNRLLGHARPGILSTDLGAANSYTNGLKAAAQIKCPTLLLLGIADRMTPPKGALKLQETILNCRTELLADVGHMMMIEEPRKTLKVLKEFLGGDPLKRISALPAQN